MPVPCKKPRYAYKNDVRLTFCGNKVVEAVKKSDILERNLLKRNKHLKSKRGKKGIKILENETNKKTIK